MKTGTELNSVPVFRNRNGSAQIRIRHIAAHHHVGVEVVGVLADGVLHDAHPAAAIVVEEGEDGRLQLGIQVLRILLAVDLEDYEDPYKD